MLARCRWRNRVNRGGSRDDASQDHKAVTHPWPAVTHLPRGGVYVHTKHGNIQFGMPPETIKDSLNLGFEVPSIFVPPKDRFNLKYGTNCCEIEFPAYWNFFVKGRSSIVATSVDAAEVIQKVVDEVLEGPASEHLFTDEEYGPDVSAETFAARPDHAKEIDFFKEPRGGRVISTDTLVRFVIFQANADGHMQADLPCDDEGGTLIVVDDGSTYHVLVDGEVVATVDDFLASAITDPPHILIPSRTQPGSSTVSAHAKEFHVPDFGLTVLGSADGFTKDGTTAGFVLWMRGRGILVDPPAHSAHYLRENGIASRKITHVILTHCHADHDAGTFQKILLEGRVTVMTTKTIMAQFIRKYSLVSGLSDDFLFRLFVFLPVRIGEPAHFQGGTLSFFYALHALPCVGFRAELDAKSITYSADTLYDPTRLLELQERGIISEARRQWLLHRGSVQASDLLLHEAGVPPIHTPAAPLLALPAAVRKNLRIIHVSDRRAAEDFQGIEMVRAGFENTISVPVPPSPYAHSTNILQMLLSTDLFRSLEARPTV